MLDIYRAYTFEELQTKKPSVVWQISTGNMFVESGFNKNRSNMLVGLTSGIDGDILSVSPDELLHGFEFSNGEPCGVKL